MSRHFIRLALRYLASLTTALIHSIGEGRVRVDDFEADVAFGEHIIFSELEESPPRVTVNLRVRVEGAAGESGRH